MQNAGIAALGLNWRYLAFEVPPQELRQAIAGAKAMRFIGLNLTVPHKLLALEMMDVLDVSAQTWGAVNTVRFEGRGPGGEWLGLGEIKETAGEVRCRGFNTDADAITRALREDLAVEPAGARIFLLGAGGAGRTAALKLASEVPAELFLVNRTIEKAEAVAAEIQSRYPQTKVTVGYPKGPVQLVLNATSLGLKESDPSPLDERQFRLEDATAAYDMVYRPAETKFLANARAAGCRTANGLSMLLFQGAKALEIWTGKPAPAEVMREALRKNVYG